MQEKQRQNVKTRMSAGFMRVGHWPETLKLIPCDQSHNRDRRDVTKRRGNVTKHPWSHPASVVTFFFCLVTKLFTEAGVDLCLVLWLSVLAFKYLPGGYAHDD